MLFISVGSHYFVYVEQKHFPTFLSSPHHKMLHNITFVSFCDKLIHPKIGPKPENCFVSPPRTIVESVPFFPISFVNVHPTTTKWS